VHHVDRACTSQSVASTVAERRRARQTTDRVQRPAKELLNHEECLIFNASKSARLGAMYIAPLYAYGDEGEFGGQRLLSAHPL
jgi:hypothetical protein